MFKVKEYVHDDNKISINFTVGSASPTLLQCRNVVCVCMDVHGTRASPAETDEPIEMPFASAQGTMCSMEMHIGAI